MGTLLEFALQRRRNGDYPVGNSSLVFTPLMRIIFALIGYLKEKDYIYVVISSIVLRLWQSVSLRGMRIKLIQISSSENLFLKNRVRPDILFCS
jgi:hypothetical protein